MVPVVMYIYKYVNAPILHTCTCNSTSIIYVFLLLSAKNYQKWACQNYQLDHVLVIQLKKERKFVT